jgi:hypothetical protein
MRRPSTVRKADVTRALEAARAAGMDVAAVEIDVVKGKITVVTTSGSSAKIADLDKWMAEDARSA